MILSYFVSFWKIEKFQKFISHKVESVPQLFIVGILDVVSIVRQDAVCLWFVHLFILFTLLQIHHKL